MQGQITTGFELNDPTYPRRRSKSNFVSICNLIELAGVLNNCIWRVTPPRTRVWNILCDREILSRRGAKQLHLESNVFTYPSLGYYLVIVDTFYPAGTRDICVCAWRSHVPEWKIYYYNLVHNFVSSYNNEIVNLVLYGEYIFGLLMKFSIDCHLSGLDFIYPDDMANFGDGKLYFGQLIFILNFE